jgi:hypothetical protein
MSAPKIKLYQLPTGYSTDGDTDIQQVTDDELIPVKDKPVTPEDFYELTGIEQVENETLLSIDFATGETIASMTPNESQVQIPSTGHTDIFVTEGDSAYDPVLYDNSLDVIAPSGYVVSPSGVSFLSAPYPSGVTMKYWRQGSASNTHFVMSNYPVYDGGNHMFKSVFFDGSDAIDRDTYTLLPPSGLVEFSTARTAPTSDYTYESATTRYFIGERENWIPPNSDSIAGGHLYMGPDIFKGLYDYPGDDTEDEGGNPIVQGEIPQFVESGEYQIDFRKGMVTFPDEVDTTTDPVYASYACLVNVRNVTGQQLTQVAAASGNYRYKVVSDNQYPGSVGARWIGRDDEVTPRNFYVDGSLKPQLTTVTPYDTLTIKTEA